MPLAWIEFAVVLLAASGFVGLGFDRRSRSGHRASTACAVLGGAAGLCGVVAGFASPASAASDYAWSLPLGRSAVGVDAISLVFLAPIFLVAAVGAIYGAAYRDPARHPAGVRSGRVFWGLLAASLAAQMIARDAVLYLFAWEIMALCAFFLVLTDHEHAEVRGAGYVYLVATHLGTLCLLAMFAVLRRALGDFALWPSASDRLDPGTADVVFVLGALGFGLKAGVMPLHVWLPGAHASAPSHVSALMSGVLVKTGVYGLVRVGAALPHPPAWWGGTLLFFGAGSAVFGVVYAAAQHDLKRLLAYSTVENVGIIVAGLGLALLGRTDGRGDWIALGLGGALLHVWNHGLMKPLLFFGAGSVAHATGTRRMDRLGGLARRLPTSFGAMLVGAVAIAGLPPLNGFVGEAAVTLGLFRAVGGDGGAARPWAALAAPAIATAGAIAVLCFVKLIGVVFLGAPRTELDPPPHEAPRPMRGAMIFYAAACVLAGLLPAALAPCVDAAAAAWSAGTAVAPAPLLSFVPLGRIAAVGVAAVALAGLVALLLGRLARGRVARVGPTWDCGYARPTARMQYTGSSFAQLFVDLFASILRTRKTPSRVEGPFPARDAFASETPETALDRAYAPAFRGAASLLSRLRFLQQGSVQAYLFYVVVALIVLLVAA